MRRYIYLFFVLFSINLKRILEYRWNAIGQVVASLVSVVLNFVFIEILFNQTSVVHGWEKYQVFFINGLARLFIGLASSLFFRGLAFIPQYTNRGDLDLFMSKPINLQFYLTFRFNRTYELISCLGGVFLIWYALRFSPEAILFTQWIFLTITSISGFIVLYSIYFILATLSIWLKRFASLPNLFRMTNDSINFPTDILGTQVSNFLTFILPIAFIVTIPSKIFFSKISLEFLIIEILVAALCLKISVWFWNYSLRHYTSASS